MMSRLSLIRLALTLVLLLEALISRSVTGSGLHQALLLAGIAAFAAAWWFGPTAAGLIGLILATGISVGGWWLFDQGVAPVTLSALPAAFHLAVGSHYWAWSRAIGARGQIPAAGESAIFHPVPVLLTLIGGALVVWSTATTEIYGTSILGVRAMAVAVLAGAALLAALSADSGAEGSVAAVVRRSGAAGKKRRLTALLAGLFIGGFAIWLGAWAQGGTDRAADALFQWVGSRSEVTELSDFGNQRPVLESGPGFDDGAMRDLPRRADIRLDSTVRFRIQFDDPREFATAARRPLYLRSSAMPIFAGDGRIGPRRQGRWIYDSDDQTADGITRIEDGSDAPPLDHWILIDRAESGAIPLMTGTRALGLPGIYAFADGWFQLALEEHQAHVRFQASATPMVWDADAAPGDLETGEAPEDYRRLPNTSLVSRIRRLVGDLPPVSAPLNDRLFAIRRLLSERCEYSLQYENPEDLEPVENFLFAERKGHCELYSAATVMLLRALSIPSRVAFGYTGGESDPGRGLIAYRQFDYHSWSEIFVKEHGWIVFDTTPMGAGAARPPRPNPRGPALAAFDPSLYENIGQGAAIGAAEIPWFSRALASALDWVSRWFPALCALAGGSMLARWWLRRHNRRDASAVGIASRSGAATSGEPARSDGLLNEYLHACAVRGCAKSPGSTLAEFLRDLKSRGLCDDEFDELTRYLYAVRYAGGHPDTERERIFRHQIAAFAQSETASI
jgi:hypothetical protein